MKINLYTHSIILAAITSICSIVHATSFIPVKANLHRAGSQRISLVELTDLEPLQVRDAEKAQPDFIGRGLVALVSQATQEVLGLINRDEFDIQKVEAFELGSLEAPHTVLALASKNELKIIDIDGPTDQVLKQVLFDHEIEAVGIKSGKDNSAALVSVSFKNGPSEPASYIAKLPPIIRTPLADTWTSKLIIELNRLNELERASESARSEFVQKMYQYRSEISKIEGATEKAIIAYRFYALLRAASYSALKPLRPLGQSSLGGMTFGSVRKSFLTPTSFLGVLETSELKNLQIDGIPSPLLENLIQSDKPIDPSNYKTGLVYIASKFDLETVEKLTFRGTFDHHFISTVVPYSTKLSIQMIDSLMFYSIKNPKTLSTLKNRILSQLQVKLLSDMARRDIKQLETLNVATKVTTQLQADAIEAMAFRNIKQANKFEISLVVSNRLQLEVLKNMLFRGVIELENLRVATQVSTEEQANEIEALLFGDVKNARFIKTIVMPEQPRETSPSINLDKMDTNKTEDKENRIDLAAAYNSPYYKKVVQKLRYNLDIDDPAMAARVTSYIKNDYAWNAFTKMTFNRIKKIEAYKILKKIDSQFKLKAIEKLLFKGARDTLFLEIATEVDTKYKLKTLESICFHSNRLKNDYDKLLLAVRATKSQQHTDMIGGLAFNGTFFSMSYGKLQNLLEAL